VCPTATKSPTLFGCTVDVVGNVKVFERHNQSANPNVRYSEVLDAGEADEPLTVDHFVFVQVLKKWGPHGASQNGITVIAL